MPQQPVTLELSATISDKTFPINSFTANIPVKVTKHRRTHHTHHKRNQSIQNSIRNQPRRGRGGEILKPNQDRKTSRVGSLSLPDGRN